MHSDILVKLTHGSINRARNSKGGGGVSPTESIVVSGDEAKSIVTTATTGQNIDRGF